MRSNLFRVPVFHSLVQGHSNLYFEILTCSMIIIVSTEKLEGYSQKEVTK